MSQVFFLIRKKEVGFQRNDWNQILKGTSILPYEEVEMKNLYDPGWCNQG